MKLRPLDVLNHRDSESVVNKNKPRPKMVACIEPQRGWFLRINSRSHFAPCFPINQTDHPWLHAGDSFLGCRILQLTELQIEDALARNAGSAIGKIAAKHIPEILKHLGEWEAITNEQLRLVSAALRFLEPNT
ncbi:hypothetical protein DY251_10870 [Mesorhizobium denitrificans]|uniref:Uncharacterized protein n=1 Tax=Mesorhizobium denitrificans TaxID=2294114 RepID=A0A371XE52_9HYPH|nr:hypothetical protein DY251_10870 [Mesorhizobium denitrificans]